MLPPPLSTPHLTYGTLHFCFVPWLLRCCVFGCSCRQCDTFTIYVRLHFSCLVQFLVTVHKKSSSQCLVCIGIGQYADSNSDQQPCYVCVRQPFVPMIMCFRLLLISYIRRCLCLLLFPCFELCVFELFLDVFFVVFSEVAFCHRAQQIMYPKSDLCITDVCLYAESTSEQQPCCFRIRHACEHIFLRPDQAPNI